jgi:hypothetical protein
MRSIDWEGGNTMATRQPTVRCALGNLCRMLSVWVLSCAVTGFAAYDITYGTGQITAQYYDSPAAEGIGNVIDHDSSTKYLTFHQTAWIQFHANASYVISTYSITSANDASERDPSTWTL